MALKCSHCETAVLRLRLFVCLVFEVAVNYLTNGFTFGSTVSNHRCLGGTSFITSFN